MYSLSNGQILADLELHSASEGEDSKERAQPSEEEEEEEEEDLSAGSDDENGPLPQSFTVTCKGKSTPCSLPLVNSKLANDLESVTG